MRIHLHALMFAGAGILASCASSEVPGAAGASVESVDRLGSYHFRQFVRATSPQVLLQGHVDFSPDTVTVHLDEAPCRYVKSQQTSRHIVYDCMGTTVTVDRRSPHRDVGYALMTTVRVSERVCVRYNTDAGIRVCIEWRLEHYDRPERRSGRLTLLEGS